MTEKDASGRWQVKGLPWEKLQAGETLTEETSECGHVASPGWEFCPNCGTRYI